MLLVTLGGPHLSQQLNGTDPYGSKWNLEVFDGWDGPEIRQDLHHVVRKHGAKIGEWEYGPRNFVLQGHCWSPTEAHMWDARLRLAASCEAVTQDGVLWVIEPGENSYEVLVRRSGRLQMKTLTSYAFEYNVPLLAADPRKYVVNEQNVHSNAPGPVTIFSAGTIDTPPFVTINGPCDTPSISGPDGQGGLYVITVHHNIPSGQNQLIDFENRALAINNVGVFTPNYGDLDPASNWWSLYPGSNSILFTSVSNTGSMDIKWRDAWI